MKLSNTQSKSEISNSPSIVVTLIKLTTSKENFKHLTHFKFVLTHDFVVVVK